MNLINVDIDVDLDIIIFFSLVFVNLDLGYLGIIYKVFVGKNIFYIDLKVNFMVINDSVDIVFFSNS